MPTIIPTDRSQLTFMSSLDDMVAPDHPVRLIDALIDKIIARDTGFFDHLAPQSCVGRRGYSAAALIKLYMYGYIHGINSSRKLQAEATRNIEVIWLLSGLKPSYKTIADYRRDYPEQIRRVNEQIVRFLTDNKWIEGERIGIDGTKLKAYTGWDMVDEQDLDRRLVAARTRLEGWLGELVANDLADELAENDPDDGVDGQPAGESQLMERIARLRQKVERLEGLKEELARQQTTRISPADPEARLMRSARLGKLPAYNLQISVDSANKMIVSALATDHPTDFEQLAPMFWASAARLGTVPGEVLADTGYADLGDVKAIEEQTTARCYIPENDAPVKNRPIRFTYHRQIDQYECSQGQPLVPKAKRRYHKDKQAYVDIYQGTECGTCQVASQCTTSKNGIRQLKVFHGAGWRHNYAIRMASWYGKQRVAERKGLVEHVFGTLRYWMGQIPLKLRGLAKVQTEIDLYSGAYNLKRWVCMDTSFKALMEQVNEWDPVGSLQSG
jgi:transposase